MSCIMEAKNGMKMSELLNLGKFKTVLIPFWHGVGDVVMVLPIIAKLRELYPEITFKLGLCKGLDQETFVTDAVLLDGDWREKALDLGYDLVYPLNFPLERMEDLSKTKAEVCCEEEVGIDPVCGHVPLKAKKFVGVCFQCTSVPWVANADPEIAQKIWNEIKEAGYVPIETQFTHCFANPDNKLMDFIDAHVRGCPARIETLMAVLNSCSFFIGTVGGNFHLALSILGPDRVMLLEKDLKREHFTKDEIATADLKDYKSEVKIFLDARHG